MIFGHFLDLTHTTHNTHMFTKKELQRHHAFRCISTVVKRLEGRSDVSALRDQASEALGQAHRGEWVECRRSAESLNKSLITSESRSVLRCQEINRMRSMLARAIKCAVRLSPKFVKQRFQVSREGPMRAIANTGKVVKRKGSSV